MRLKPTETILRAAWHYKDGKVKGDEINQRIQLLIEKYLEKVTTNSTGWEVLYKDPKDGRYWELTYPHGDWHGGGPPQLKYLTKDEAERKFDV